MLRAAERMKALGQADGGAGEPASIFGSALSLAKTISADERFRISVYPFLSGESPDAAMGLASCFCYLLEQYPDTRVYRCFARIHPADESDEISESDYQFTPDAWELEGLADNVCLAGEWRREGEGFELRLDLDADLALEDSGGDLLVFRCADLTDAVNQLPAIALELWTLLAGAPLRRAIIAYDALPAPVSNLERLLELVFAWNLDVYLYLWDVEWDEGDVRAQFLEVAGLWQERPTAFAAWCLGMLAKQAMQPGISELGEDVAALAPDVFGPGTLAAPGAAAAALGLASLGRVQAAANLLEPHLQPESSAGLWDALCEIHLESGQFAEALDICQLALESGLRHAALYWRYAQLLMTAEINAWPVDEVLLIDPAEYEEDAHITLEIAYSLKLYLADEDDLGALQLALTYMVDGGDEELWLYFDQLAQKDVDGAFIGEVIDRVAEMDDHERAYEVLQSQLDANAYAFVFLAQLALADGDTAYALESIAACRASLAEIDDELELELQRLNLGAALPSFEEDFAEIKVALSANRPAAESDVDLLERAIELAPKLVDLHLILSRCYRSWKDGDSALEVLEEAKREAGGDPQLDLGIAQIYWSRSARAEAVAILNAALTQYPRDVGLLAQMANFLLQNNQFEDARQYIERAEAIAPSHPAIWQVRRLIAQKMAR